jgi:hypothetical protein
MDEAAGSPPGGKPRHTAAHSRMIVRHRECRIKRVQYGTRAAISNAWK